MSYTRDRVGGGNQGTPGGPGYRPNDRSARMAVRNAARERLIADDRTPPGVRNRMAANMETPEVPEIVIPIALGSMAIGELIHLFSSGNTQNPQQRSHAPSHGSNRPVDVARARSCDHPVPKCNPRCQLRVGGDGCYNCDCPEGSDLIYIKGLLLEFPDLDFDMAQNIYWWCKFYPDEYKPNSNYEEPEVVPVKDPFAKV